MTLHVLTAEDRNKERLRTVETVAWFDVFGMRLDLFYSRSDGYFLRGDAMTVLFQTPRSDVCIASHPIHGTDDQDAVELARREVLTLVKRAHRRFVESLTVGRRTVGKTHSYRAIRCSARIRNLRRTVRGSCD